MKVIKRNPLGRLAAALTTLVVVIGLFILQTSCTNSDEVDTPVSEMAEENVEEQQNAAVAPEGTATPEQQDDAVAPEGSATPEQLIEAVRAGHLEEVQLLLDAGADVNATMNARSGSWVYNQAPAITHAVLTNHSEVVELLIAYGADLELAELGYLDTALHTAAHLNNADIVKILLESGADPNPISRHTNWETPLHYAAEAGAIDAVQALLDGGVEVDVRIDQGRSPMMNIIKEGRSGYGSPVVRVLLDNGADPSLQDNSGSTALHYAAMNGRTDTIQLLIEHGASLDLTNDLGNTALHLAASRSKSGAVSVLIEQGASLDLKNDKGETALDVAKEDEIIEMLRQAEN
jgi:ankyrin repeat protein